MNKQATNLYPHSSTIACGEIRNEYAEPERDVVLSSARLDKLEECIKKNLCPKCKDRLKCLTRKCG